MALSARAAVILEQMVPGCSYEAKELRAFVPDLTLEQLHDLMRRLSGGAPGRAGRILGVAAGTLGQPVAEATRSGNHRPASAGVRHKPVKPEDLFDHGAFEDMFK